MCMSMMMMSMSMMIMMMMITMIMMSMINKEYDEPQVYCKGICGLVKKTVYL